MLKVQYLSTGEPITTLRAILHLVTWPLFLYLNEPLIAICYFTSFLFHRLPNKYMVDKLGQESSTTIERWLRLFDHMFILIRVLYYSGTGTGVENPPLLIVSHVLLAAACLSTFIINNHTEDIWYRSIRIYILFSAATIVFCNYLLDTHDKYTFGTFYLLPGLIYFIKPTLWWHNKHWDYHDDFHLGTLAMDFLHYI
jgi:predicted membrane channel-forming protein YqfA (hemolysin III family)